MPTSQNGLSANDRSVIASYTVPGTALRVSLRTGDVSVVLLEYLRRYNLEVEPLTHNPQDLWGYAERNIRGSSTTLSNHASGTAVDCRATRHGLGQTGTFTPTELRALYRLVDSFGGVLRHGVDYDTPARGGVRGSRPDPMHIEINAGPAAVARIANKIRGGGQTTPPAPPPPAPLRSGDDMVYVKSQLQGPVGPTSTAMWSGPMFVALGPTEVPGADDNIRRGALVQWVEPGTWHDLDARSHALCDSPRAVVVADTHPAP